MILAGFPSQYREVVSCCEDPYSTLMSLALNKCRIDAHIRVPCCYTSLRTMTSTKAQMPCESTSDNYTYCFTKTLQYFETKKGGCNNAPSLP
jgi:hypothetical protein